MAFFDNALSRVTDGATCFHVCVHGICGADRAYARCRSQRAYNECLRYIGSYLTAQEAKFISARCKEHRNLGIKSSSIDEHLKNLVSYRKAREDNDKALLLVKEIKALRSADEKFVKASEYKSASARYHLILQSTSLLPELSRIVEEYSKHVYFWACRWDRRPVLQKAEVMFYILDHNGVYLSWQKYPEDGSVPSVHSYTKQSLDDGSTQNSDLMNEAHIYHGWTFNAKVSEAGKTLSAEIYHANF